MSIDPEQPVPPRRPRPRPAPSSLIEGQETFQPSPKSPVAGVKRARPIDREPSPVSGGPNWAERIVFGKVSSGHLATFCGRFATYQDAGVDLLRTLASLQKQFARSALGPVIGRIETAVRSGEAVGEAMAREPQAFDKLCVAMMRVAEARGGVPETMRLMAKHYEARQRMIRQARSALIQPVAVLSVAIVVILLLTIFVVPKMVEFIRDGFRGRAPELPWPTQVLVFIGDFMVTIGWWAVPIGLVVGVVGGAWWYRTPAGRAMIDSLTLYVPVLGKIRTKIETGRFARTLSALLAAGVNIGESLQLTSGVLGLGAYKRAILGVKSLVMDGTELSQAMAEDPPIRARRDRHHRGR